MGTGKNKQGATHLDREYGGGISFLGRKVSQVIEEMRHIGYRASEGNGGVDFAEVGIALTVPSGIVDVIAAHRMGHSD